MRFPQFIAVASLALLCFVAPGHAEKRVALVIGNDHYANLPAHEQLQKAVKDAQAVGGALQQIGFDVISGENLGRQALLARLDAAAQRLKPGDSVFFFFAGHGVAVNGVNYILPADVPAASSGQIASLTGAAVKEEDITDRFMSAGARVAVVVLDACRNNPFAISGTRGIGGERGLSPHEPPSGVFTLYSAGRGQAALDRLTDSDSNPNSVFTRVLLPALARTDLDLPALAVEVRDEVTRLARSVSHDQRPAYYDETSGGRIFLAERGSPGGGDQALPLPPPPPPGLTGRPPEVAGGQPAAAVLMPHVASAMPDADPCSGPVTASFSSRCAAPLTTVQERGLQPKDTFRECENCPEMVVLPAGSFTMGSPKGEKDRESDEGPQHTVTIGKPFAVGKFHVTVDQFATFVRETGYEASLKCWTFEDRKGEERAGRSWRNPGFAQEGSHPVVCVTWDDAKAYVAWMAKKTGKPYRLLSEAEFEYAARGRTAPGVYPRFWFGNEDKDLCRNANGADEKARDSIEGAKNWTIAPCYDGYAYTAPAGHYQPNAFGLYDMAGNTFQWTEDCHHDSYNGAPADGSSWTTEPCNNGRVARGGSWYYGTFALRAAYRFWLTVVSGCGVGFRVARMLTP